MLGRFRLNNSSGIIVTVSEPRPSGSVHRPAAHQYEQRRERPVLWNRQLGSRLKQRVFGQNPRNRSTPLEEPPHCAPARGEPFANGP